MCAKKMWNSKVKQPNQKSLKSTYCDAYSNADFLAEMGTLSGGVTRPVWSRGVIQWIKLIEPVESAENGRK